MKFYIVLSTVPSLKVADHISRQLIRNHWAACVNIVKGVKSIFWWKGKVDQVQEYLLIIKTSRRHFPALSRCIQKSHPYEVPEIVGFPLSCANRSYSLWLEQTLRKHS